MKRKYILVLLLIILSLSLFSCNKNVASDDKEDNKTGDNTDNNTSIINSIIENKAVLYVGKEYLDDYEIVALVLNDLSSEKIDSYKKNISIEEYGDNSYESALIVPIYNNMKISVYRADYKDNELVKDELLYESKNTENYGFLLRYERPEGMPLIITVEGNNISEEFYYSYNGKEANPELEVITKMNTDTQ